MKLQKFFKSLLIISALSFMLMGCADDSGSGNTTQPETVLSVFTKFVTDFQAAPTKNADTPVEFTTKIDSTANLTVPLGTEVQYLVALDKVMESYYGMLGTTDSTLLLTNVGQDSDGNDLISGLSQIIYYAQVPAATKGNTETTIPLNLTVGTNNQNTGMFVLMNEENVKALDTALQKLLDEFMSAQTGIEIDVTKIQVATVKNVVGLINANLYKVAYDTPVQPIKNAFAAAQRLTLTPSMAFNEGDNPNSFEIAANGLSFVDSNPAIAADAVVVFLDEFKAQLEGVTDVAKVKGTAVAENIKNTNITSDTLKNSANTDIITYTASSLGNVNGATYVAIVDNTLWSQINTTTNGDAFYTLNTALGGDGATKAEVEAALALLSGKIYKVDYNVNTIQSLINAFKASQEVTTAMASAITLEDKGSGPSAIIKGNAATWGTNTNVYCLDLSTEDPSLTLSSLDGNTTNASAPSGFTYALVAAAQASGGDGSINFTLTNGQTVKGQTVYAYCSSAADRTSSNAFEITGTTNYEKLNGFLEALKADLKVYSYNIQSAQPQP